METNDYLERLELRATVPTIRRVPAGRITDWLAAG